MLTLLVAILCFVAWVIFAFILKVGPGAIHLLLAVSGTLLVRWWALRTPGQAAK